MVHILHLIDVSIIFILINNSLPSLFHPIYVVKKQSHFVEFPIFWIWLITSS